MNDTEEQLRLRKLKAEVELLERETLKCRRCGGRGTILENNGVNTSGGHNGHIRYGGPPPAYRVRCPVCGGSGRQMPR